MVERGSDNLVWQYFVSESTANRDWGGATQAGRFRQAIGAAGEEELLWVTVDTAVAKKALWPQECEWNVVRYRGAAESHRESAGKPIAEDRQGQGGSRRQRAWAFSGGTQVGGCVAVSQSRAITLMCSSSSACGVRWNGFRGRVLRAVLGQRDKVSAVARPTALSHLETLL